MINYHFYSTYFLKEDCKSCKLLLFVSTFLKFKEQDVCDFLLSRKRKKSNLTHLGNCTEHFFVCIGNPLTPNHDK